MNGFHLEKYLPKKTLVVEDDKNVQMLIQMGFKDYGFKHVDAVSDGEQAWEALMNHDDYDLMILDWKLPVLNGTQLLNRIRTSRRYAFLPVVILSGYLGKDDISFLNENFFTARMSKPFSQEDLLKVAKSVMRDHFDYIKIYESLEKLFYKTAGQSMAKVTETVERWLQNYGQNPEGSSLASSLLRSFNGFEPALNILMSTLKIHPQNALLYHHLGLTHMATAEYDSAVANFLQADKISPQNIQRKLLLADLAFHKGNTSLGRDLIEKAQALDPLSPKVLLATEVLEYIEGRFSGVKISSLENGLASMLAFMSNDKTKESQYDEAINIYEKALAITRDAEARSKLFFNIGVCCARLGQKEHAISALYRAVDLKPNFGKPIDALKMFGIDPLKVS